MVVNLGLSISLFFRTLKEYTFLYNLHFLNSLFHKTLIQEHVSDEFQFYEDVVKQLPEYLHLDMNSGHQFDKHIVGLIHRWIDIVSKDGGIGIGRDQVPI